MVAAEVPNSTVAPGSLGDPMGTLHRAGVFASTSEARRTIAQKGLRVNGRVLSEGESLDAAGLLHNRWILVRKGKTGYHLLSVTS